ncbi:MAG: DUF742 domain-containing protein [Nocardioidaceae bacterium]
MAPIDPGEMDREGEHLARFVRPYTLTAGRTKATVDLPLEATLVRLAFSDDLELSTGARQVLETCNGRSVAEVASLVSIPIGVVRVLLSDLVDQDFVQVQQTLTETSPVHDRIALIERTLSALRTY